MNEYKQPNTTINWKYNRINNKFIKKLISCTPSPRGPQP